MKRYLKSELARAAGVSSSTFRRWMNMHRDELAELGLMPTDHLVPPRALRFICESYDIDMEELIA